MSVKSKKLESFIVVPENEVLLLDDSESLWVIESGSMTVYAGKVQSGALQSARRYLFEVETGEALFGFALEDVQNSTPLDGSRLQTGYLSPAPGETPSSLLSRGLEPTNSICILAVATTETRLLRMTLGELESDRTPDYNASTNSFTAIHLITTWFERLSSVFQLTTIPLPPPQLSSQTPRDTQRVILKNFHDSFVSSLQELDHSAQQENLIQFQARERLNQKMTTTALAGFVSLLDTQESSAALIGDPLLIAAGAVGRAMEIPIRPAAKSEDMKRVKDPLEAIARASRMRIRRVLLSERWWRDDCGPLLAYLQDQTPVALLPVNNKYYEIYHPVISCLVKDLSLRQLQVQRSRGAGEQRGGVFGFSA
ncbi:hypothetical protein LC593_20640 [Nostoc sp. CHAB 5844]|nr:hypothetical protein [Nostoc sp. CHAB 5844]